MTVKKDHANTTLGRLQSERHGIANSLKEIEKQANNPYAGPLVHSKALKLKRDLVIISIKVAEEARSAINRKIEAGTGDFTITSDLQRQKEVINGDIEILRKLENCLEEWAGLSKKQAKDKEEETRNAGRITELKRTLEKLEKQLQ